MPTPALAANLLSFVMPLTAAGLVPALLLAHIGWAQALKQRLANAGLASPAASSEVQRS